MPCRSPLTDEGRRSIPKQFNHRCHLMYRSGQSVVRFRVVLQLSSGKGHGVAHWRFLAFGE